MNILYSSFKLKFPLLFAFIMLETFSNHFDISVKSGSGIFTKQCVSILSHGYVILMTFFREFVYFIMFLPVEI